MTVDSSSGLVETPISYNGEGDFDTLTMTGDPGGLGVARQTFIAGDPFRFDPFEGKENRYAMFDKVVGTGQFRPALIKDYDFEALRKFWSKDEKAFVQKSTKYYLYK